MYHLPVRAARRHPACGEIASAAAIRSNVIKKYEDMLLDKL